MASTLVKGAAELLKASVESKAVSTFSPLSSIIRFPCSFTPVISPPADLDKFIVTDVKSVKEKIRRMKRDGLSNFQIVTDFDYTLTKSMHESKLTHSSFKFIIEAFLDKQTKKRLEEKFRACKNNAYPEKLSSYESWTLECVEEILKQNYDIDMFKREPKEAFIIPRGHLDNFLHVCSKYEIPYYMISAGISNVITQVLDHYGNLGEYKNLSLCANEMIFDERGLLLKFKEPRVDPYSKNEILQLENSKRNVLLIGDHIQDTCMVKNIKMRNLLTVGYLNYHKGSMTRRYIKAYDIVVLTEGSLALPEMITKYILDLESENSFFAYLDSHICRPDEGVAQLISQGKGTKH